MKLYESEFIGKIDKKQARIYSLQVLMKFIEQGNYRITQSKRIELIYKKDINILELNIIN